MSKPIPSLEELINLFGRIAANEELDKPMRAFASQMTILTAHVRRLQSGLKEKDQQIGELAALVLAAQTGKQAPTDGAQAPIPPTEGDAEQPSEEDEAIAMAENLQRETEAEMRTLQAKTQPQKPDAPPMALVKGNGAPADGAA
jgi:hypothetical protein